MKRQIRKGVWETNSSSCHSLTVLKSTSNDYYTREEIRDSVWLWKGRLQFTDWNMYFGRSPFRTLNDFEGKLRYAVACLVNKYGDKYYNELFDICKKYVTGFEDFEFPMQHKTCRAIIGDERVDPKEDDWDYEYAKTEEQMEEYLNENYPMPEGSEAEFWQYERDEDEEPDKYWHFSYFNFGGTDDYCLGYWLDKENISLEEFLTNRRYIVICDGDEYCVWKDMKKSGLINVDAIEKEI